MKSISFIFQNFDISKAVNFINFICVLSRVDTVIFNEVTVVEICLLKQWSETVNKCQHLRKQLAISLFEDGVNQHRIVEISGASQSVVYFVIFRCCFFP